jgi:hypothetical protein
LLLALAFAWPAAAFAQQISARFETRPQPAETRWFKGNTHSHTTESDGDSPPEVVASWYRNHGYNFLVISDHNVWVDPGKLAHLVDSTFLLIPGEEVTSAYQKKAVHVNGLNVPKRIEPRTDTTMLGTIQKNIDAVRDLQGVPHINHPNFQWAFDHQILRHVRNDRLIEIFNGHPLVHNEGGGDRASMEEVWDHLLSDGMRMYGIAVDDAHHFKEEFAPHRSNPGRGWVVVRATGLHADAILEAMERGDFYASTGIELDDVVITSSSLEVHIRQRGDFKHTTEFIGSGGRVLLRTGANPARYQITGSEGYVRARVRDSGGFRAWIQPVFISSN